MRTYALSFLLRPVLGLAFIAASFPAGILAAPVSSYKIVKEFPHSTDSYTEGFFQLDGLFYEGTGLKGTSAILVIEPETGKVIQRRDLSPQFFGVIGWINLTGLMPESRRVSEESVLNGIAYDAQHDRLFVTGKQWPNVFQIKIVRTRPATSSRLRR